MGSRGTRVLLVGSLLVNAAALGGAGWYVADRGARATAEKIGIVDPTPPDYPALGQERFGDLPGAEVILVGDSQVQNGQWSELLGVEAANRGIGGQTTADVADWVNVALGSDEPVETVIVWVGTNDLLSRVPPARTADDMSALLAEVGDSQPTAEVLVLTVPPVSGYDVTEVNAAIVESARARGAVVVDVTTALSADGLIHADGVHLTAAGYVAVGQSLAPHVAG